MALLNRKVKVVVDDKIPYIREAICRLSDDVVFAPGSAIDPDLVADADALIIRTRTRCDRHLLAGSRVQFIATATIGFDHIDTAFCQANGIHWTNAPGCNAASVAQYLHSVLLLLLTDFGRPASELKLGVVGVGHVGSKVAELGRRLGFRVLLNDPPRQRREPELGFQPLQVLARECDILTLHVPLSREADPTYHLADDRFFAMLGRRPAIVNTSRGEVMDTDALLRAMDAGRVGRVVVDVWENEPHPSPDLLRRAFIATPHIAGYSADGKANATRMSLEAMARHFGLKADFSIVPPPPINPIITANSMADAILQIYDPRHDCMALRANPTLFEQLRGNYPLRREAEAYDIRIRAGGSKA